MDCLFTILVKRQQCYFFKFIKFHLLYLIFVVGPSAIIIENVTPDNKIPGIEGQDMTIKCTSVGGQPPPDTKLVVLGSTYTGKQSALFTFKPIRSNDGANVTCQAGYEDIKGYSLTTSANIHLKRKYETLYLSNIKHYFKYFSSY